MYYVKIPNNLIDEGYIRENDYFLLVMALIQRNMTIRNEIIFTHDYLFEMLNISSNNTRHRKEIENSIEYLIKIGLIKNIHAIGNLIKVNIDDAKENYFTLSDEEVDKILTFEKENKYKVFNILCCLKRSINNDTKVTFLGQEKIKELTGYSSTSIVKYKKLLHDIGLINIASIGAVVTTEGKIINACDYISATIDDPNGEILKEKIAFEKTKTLNEYGRLYKKIEGNKKRSESMKKYWAEKKENDVEEVKKEQKEKPTNCRFTTSTNIFLKENSSIKSENCQMDLNKKLKKMSVEEFAEVTQKIMEKDKLSYEYLKTVYKINGKQLNDKVISETAKIIQELGIAI